MKVFANSSSSRDNGNKTDKSIFVQKRYLRTNYTESNIEEDIKKKGQLKVKNKHCPVENTDAVCKAHVDRGLNDPNIIRNTARVDFNRKNFQSVRSVKLNSLPAV